MKREILCKPCGQKVRRIIMPSEPGEYSKFVPGKLKLSCVCDNCATELPKGTQAEALSIWADAIPYRAWEDEYLETQT